MRTWYAREDLGERRLDLEINGPTFEILLKKNDVPIPLSDVGQGMHQVFPIVVQQYLPVEAPRMEIFEEPESHLHPSAHAAIADLFWQGISNPDRQRLVETHSEVLLLRIRRAVAEGRIKPEDVALFWIDDEDEVSSEVKPLFVKPNGEVDDWPAEVFSEDYREVLAIRRAQRP